MIGGTASKLGGGNFANGAVTGAFSRLYNDEGGKASAPAEKDIVDNAECNGLECVRFPDAIRIGGGAFLVGGTLTLTRHGDFFVSFDVAKGYRDPTKLGGAISAIYLMQWDVPDRATTYNFFNGNSQGGGAYYYGGGELIHSPKNGWAFAVGAGRGVFVNPASVARHVYRSNSIRW